MVNFSKSSLEYSTDALIKIKTYVERTPLILIKHNFKDLAFLDTLCIEVHLSKWFLNIWHLSACHIPKHIISILIFKGKYCTIVCGSKKVYSTSEEYVENETLLIICEHVENADCKEHKSADIRYNNENDDKLQNLGKVC